MHDYVSIIRISEFHVSNQFLISLWGLLHPNPRLLLLHLYSINLKVHQVTFNSGVKLRRRSGREAPKWEVTILSIPKSVGTGKRSCCKVYLCTVKSVQVKCFWDEVVDEVKSYDIPEEID